MKTIALLTGYAIFYDMVAAQNRNESIAIIKRSDRELQYSPPHVRIISWFLDIEGLIVEGSIKDMCSRGNQNTLRNSTFLLMDSDFGCDLSTKLFYATTLGYSNVFLYSTVTPPDHQNLTNMQSILEKFPSIKSASLIKEEDAMVLKDLYLYPYTDRFIAMVKGVPREFLEQYEIRPNKKDTFEVNRVVAGLIDLLKIGIILSVGPFLVIGFVPIFCRIPNEQKYQQNKTPIPSHDTNQISRNCPTSGSRTLVSGQTILQGSLETKLSRTASLETQSTDTKKDEEMPIFMPDDLRCTICLEIMQENGICKLRCSHAFHSVCINEWIIQGNTHACPNCRYEITNQDPGFQNLQPVRQNIIIPLELFLELRLQLRQHQRLQMNETHD